MNSEYGSGTVYFASGNIAAMRSSTISLSHRKLLAPEHAQPVLPGYRVIFVTVVNAWRMGMPAVVSEHIPAHPAFEDSSVVFVLSTTNLELP